MTYRVSASNTIVPAAAEPRVFRVLIDARAGGCTDLDRREVFIVVPPAAI